MYYYYAVTQSQKCNVIQYNDIIGRCDTKAKAIMYFLQMGELVLSIIELTEDEYSELKRNTEKKQEN